MLCRACGMESRTANVCEWCNKSIQGTGPSAAPIVNAPSLNAPSLHAPAAPSLNVPTTTAPTPTARIQRTTLTGEVIDVPTSGEAAPLAAPGMFAPPDKTLRP